VKDTRTIESSEESTLSAQRAYASGELAQAARRLTRCPVDDDPDTQLRLANELRSVATTTLRLGELLVRYELAHPGAPAHELGREIIRDLDAALPCTDAAESDARATKTKSCAPAGRPFRRSELEELLSVHLAPTRSLLRAPFGVARAHALHLVECDHRGYDIWWSGIFFAVRRGRSPYVALQLVRLLRLARAAILRMRAVGRRLAAHVPAGLRRSLLRMLLRSPGRKIAQGELTGPFRFPLVRLRVASTAPDLHRLIAAVKRRS
jgi:hypothetical protein